jgi:flavodoxin
MKKLLASILAVMLVMAMTSCSGGNSGASGGDQAAQQNTDDKSIVVYFSCTGNTKAVAEEIAAQTGSDLHEIVPEEPYTEEDLNYNDDNCRANAEMNDPESRPAISNTIENLSDYDTIYIGYPIWWGSLPRIMNTFFDTYDFSGKTIVPFCTSGSSSISQSVSVIREAEPEAQVKEGLQVSSSGADDSSDEVSRWLEEIK